MGYRISAIVIVVVATLGAGWALGMFFLKLRQP